MTSVLIAPAEDRARPRLPRAITNSLVALAIAASTIGGGVVGSAATIQWMNASTATQSVSGLPVAQQTAATAASNAIDSASAAVVEISTTTVTQGRFRGGTVSGTGSGVLIADDGLIVTNLHVVNGASSIRVTFSNGSTTTATVATTDSAHDLALLEVASVPDGIPVAVLGDSDAVAVGETAIAVGSPFGLEQTVTQGIISATGRTWSSGSTTMTDMLQTDAAINPGNSGGPLLNASGEVVGINTLIESPVEGSVGIGFAVPVNVVKALLEA